MVTTLEYDLDHEITIRRRGKTRIWIVLGILLLVTMTTAAYFIGYYVRPISTKQQPSYSVEKLKETHKTFQGSINTKNIEDTLR